MGEEYKVSQIGTKQILVLVISMMMAQPCFALQRTMTSLTGSSDRAMPERGSDGTAISADLVRAYDYVKDQGDDK